MLSATARLLYRAYGGRVFMDVKVWNTLEPHAEKITFENIPVDPNVTGLVLPLTLPTDEVQTRDWISELMQKDGPLELRSLDQLQRLARDVGILPHTTKAALIQQLREASAEGRHTRTGGHLLQSVFPSWPRLHHQREFERPYLDKRIKVLELGPFEVELGGLERPFVCNVQFAPEMPLTPEGRPDIRIGRDMMRRSHYLGAEGALMQSVDSSTQQRGVDLSRVAPYGSVPTVSEGKRVEGAGRLYTEDKIRMGWVVEDGKVVSQPPVALSRVRDLVADQYASRKAESSTAYEAPRPASTTTSHSETQRRPAKKRWEGWK